MLKIRSSMLALCLVGALAVCGGETTAGSPDAGTLATDAGGLPADAGLAATDAGATATDGGSQTAALTVADHRAVEAFASLSPTAIAQVAATPIFYGHTSHGSQLVAGVSHLEEEFHFTQLSEQSADLGSGSWDSATETFLAAHPETRVVVWSWCGQQSSNSAATVQGYLSKMEALELAHPEVDFIYMTGHLRGAYSDYLYEDEENARLQANNQTVRDYAAAHGKWLFDFADVESYLDGSSAQCLFHSMPSECTWPEEPTWSCAHSRAPNCLRKGKAFYWLLARILGLTQ